MAGRSWAGLLERNPRYGAPSGTIPGGMLYCSLVIYQQWGEQQRASERKNQRRYVLRIDGRCSSGQVLSH
jgi:hypothetical protein